MGDQLFPEAIRVRYRPQFGHGATGSGIERWAPPWAPSPAPGGCGMSERDQNSGTADCKPSDSAWKVGGRRSVAAPALVALVDGGWVNSLVTASPPDPWRN